MLAPFAPASTSAEHVEEPRWLPHGPEALPHLYSPASRRGATGVIFGVAALQGLHLTV